MSFWVAGSIVAAGAIGAYGASSAADTQASAQLQGAGIQQGMFNTINAQEQPFIQAGYGATTKLSDLLGTSGNTGATGYGSLIQPFTPTQETLNNYPGYQFALQTGGQAIRNADTPGVGALSGPALKDLMNFNVGTANQYYGQYFNQYQTQQNNIFNRLSNLAGLGQSAATQVGNSGTQLRQGIAGATAAAGGSQAAGTVGVANALGGSAVPLAYLMSRQAGGGGGGGGWNAPVNLAASAPNYFGSGS